jgi:hypothetical protein
MRSYELRIAASGSMRVARSDGTAARQIFAR